MVEAGLHDRHVLVTGGGTGIGAAIARVLGEQGARVSVLGRRLEVLQQQARVLPQARAVVCDLTRLDDIAAAFARATDEFGPIDILVNNAGRVETQPFHKVDAALWSHTMALNVDAVFACMAEVYPGMRARGWGRIVNIASTAALKGYAYVAAYCAAKHAVLGLTRAVALEAAATGVTVNAVCPGYTDTDIIGDAVRVLGAKTGRSVEHALGEFTRTNPQGRLVKPEEVANAVLWLCAPGSESITGQAIAVAGGEVM